MQTSYKIKSGKYGGFLTTGWALSVWKPSFLTIFKRNKVHKNFKRSLPTFNSIWPGVSTILLKCPLNKFSENSCLIFILLHDIPLFLLRTRYKLTPYMCIYINVHCLQLSSFFKVFVHSTWCKTSLTVSMEFGFTMQGLPM